MLFVYLMMHYEETVLDRLLRKVWNVEYCCPLSVSGRI